MIAPQRAQGLAEDGETRLAMIHNQRRHLGYLGMRGARSGQRGRIKTLTQLRDQLDGCIGCGCLSLKACPLRNVDDAMAQQGAGPHFD